MNFRDMVKQSLRTPDQLEQERVQHQRRRAAEYIYGLIKTAILNAARTGQARGTTLTGTVPFPHNGAYDDVIPYGDLFCTEVTSNSKRSGGLISYRDIERQHMKVQDVDTLREVFILVRSLCAKDGIQIGEPFILCQITDCSIPRVVKKTTRTAIRGNSLKASVTTVRHGSSFNWKGETATLSLAVDYSFSL